MPKSLLAPLLAYAASATCRTPARPPMDALAECRPQVETLVARILRRAKDDPDVQDCTSDTLHRVLEQKDKLLEGGALLPWVLGVARHVALDSLRAEYRRRARVASPLSPERNEQPVELLPGQDPGPEALVSERQNLQRLQEAIGMLPPQQREVLLLLHVQGLGYREIASRLGVPLGTVGTWVLRGREALTLALTSAGSTSHLPRKDRS